jgi:hypothetical protein
MEMLQSLYGREMNRREFLVYLGLLVLSITGISGILNNIFYPKLLNIGETKRVHGFGFGTYGGTPGKENN